MAYNSERDPRGDKVMERASLRIETILTMLTVVGSVGSAVLFLSSKIYTSAEAATMVAEEIKGLQTQIIGIVPRIERLEITVQGAQTDAATARQRADDMKETLDEVKVIAQKGLDVSNSHTPILDATRRAIAPRATDK